LPIKWLKANVSLLQFSWKAVPQLRTCSCKTPVSIVAVCVREWGWPAVWTKVPLLTYLFT